MSVTRPRLPIEPLIEYARLRYRAHDENTDVTAGPPSWLHQALGYEYPDSTVRGWCHKGLPVSKGDEVATALGHHPTRFWPDYGQEYAA